MYVYIYLDCSFPMHNLITLTSMAFDQDFAKDRPLISFKRDYWCSNYNLFKG